MLIQLLVGVVRKLLLIARLKQTGEEFSYPAKVTYPDLVNTVSPQASLGMNWKNFLSY